MKTIGLLGGLSWHSTVEYYKYINEEVGRRLGLASSARINMCSVNLEDIRTAGSAAKRTEIIVGAAKSIEDSGADFIVICANTPHLEAQAILSQVKIPLLHIVDTVQMAIQKRGFQRVCLLATKMTMQAGFYESMLAEKNIELIKPTSAEIDRVDEIIQSELMLGRIVEKSRDELKSIIFRMKDQGAQGAILGCTELPLILSEELISFGCFDTTRIHATAAVDWALS